MATGREPETDEELVFDSVLAKKHQLLIGDRVEIMGKNFQIVGLSKNTTSWMTSFVFIRKTAAEELIRTPGATSFLLVASEPNLEPLSIEQQLLKISGSGSTFESYSCSQ